MPAGLDDFSKVDLSELEAWLKMAQDEFGFYTIVRPGPFICAEWAGGAYPRWLAKFGPGTGGFWLRGADDAHIAWSVHWYEAVCSLFAREQLTRKPVGGKGIIMVQIENEYDHFSSRGKAEVLRALYDAVRRAGIEVPVFSCMTRECRASKDPVLSQVFDCDNYYVGLTDAPGCAQRMMRPAPPPARRPRLRHRTPGRLVLNRRRRSQRGPLLRCQPFQRDPLDVLVRRGDRPDALCVCRRHPFRHLGIPRPDHQL